jgi:hypothetical protein
MRRAALALLIAVLPAAGPVLLRAQDRGFGAGIVLGEPTGLSAKMWLSERNAVDAGVSWAFGREGYFSIHADYLWHFANILPGRERLVPYVGIGGRLGVPRDTGVLGIRIPVGIAFWPRGAPVDVFFEVAPVLDLVPATEVSGNVGIGARYFF